MKRRQLFEIEDQPWLPAAFRDAIRRYLAAAWRMTPLPQMWAKHLLSLLDSTGFDQIVDLGSGSGGPAPVIVKEMRKSGLPVRAILTDLYPDEHGGARDPELGIEYWPEPVNAVQVPESLTGVVTMFASFHHFPPAAAQGILRNAFVHRRPICVFEMTSRTRISALSCLLVPLAVWVITPRVRPMSLFQLVFTYLIPVLPLMVFWDAFVSQLRTYSPDDFRAMTADLVANDYQWECKEVRVAPFPSGVPYLIGRPTNVGEFSDKVQSLMAAAP
jgi:hypothetical protein